MAQKDKLLVQQRLIDDTDTLEESSPSRSGQRRGSGELHGDSVDEEFHDYHEQGTVIGAFSAIFKGGLIAPAGTTYDSIRLLLTAPNREERDRLTEQWRDHKLQELNFIGIVGALLAGCLTSTGSWPTILQNGRTQPWTVRVCWYCGIVFALLAILTAAQQSIRLHRLSAHRDALANIRHYMGSRTRDREGAIEIRPRRFQIYGWQASIMFLTLSVLAMLLGMSLLVWCSTQFGPSKSPDDGWWDDSAKLAMTWSTIASVSIIAFVAAQMSLALRNDEA